MAPVPASVVRQAELLDANGKKYFEKRRFLAAVDAHTEWTKVEADSRKALELDSRSTKTGDILLTHGTSICTEDSKRKKKEKRKEHMGQCRKRRKEKGRRGGGEGRGERSRRRRRKEEEEEEAIEEEEEVEEGRGREKRWQWRKRRRKRKEEEEVTEEEQEEKRRRKHTGPAISYWSGRNHCPLGDNLT
ncbi:hypothetical protein GW17_00013028 [Ensete ventricosum]|nr:hypothetical protein GW17_00013028 [Ensete ventricosum]RZR85598.1 hypothetical protein BHM03_00012616 [Ensete ventricosum]